MSYMYPQHAAAPLSVEEHAEAVSAVAHIPARTQKSALATYKATLKSLRRASMSKSGRAGKRRQAALQATSDRHHIRVRDVKNIVRVDEYTQGRKREHSKVEIRNKQYRLDEEQFVASLTEEELITCGTCGTENASVAAWPDPSQRWEEERLTPTLACAHCRVEARAAMR